MRTYEVRTYGCQMNVHDSERLRGLLEDAGYVRAPEGDQADVVVFNTCAVRENADNKLYGNLGHLAPVKAKKPGMQIAVGGCLAQKDKATITKKAPWVDVCESPHTTVIPGWVAPSSGPITCTMPWAESPSWWSSIPKSAVLRLSCATCASHWASP